jgi:hypothetical protein
VDAFSEDRSTMRNLWAGSWFLVTSQLSIIIYGHLRVTYLGGDILLGHIIGVLFVFFLPFILAQFSVLDNYNSNLEKTL